MLCFRNELLLLPVDRHACARRRHAYAGRRCAYAGRQISHVCTCQHGLSTSDDVRWELRTAAGMRVCRCCPVGLQATSSHARPRLPSQHDCIRPGLHCWFALPAVDCAISYGIDGSRLSTALWPVCCLRVCLLHARCRPPERLPVLAVPRGAYVEPCRVRRCVPAAATTRHAAAVRPTSSTGSAVAATYVIVFAPRSGASHGPVIHLPGRCILARHAPALRCCGTS